MIDSNPDFIGPKFPDRRTICYGNKESTDAAREFFRQFDKANSKRTDFPEHDGAGQSRYGGYRTLTDEERVELGRRQQINLAAAQRPSTETPKPQHSFRGMTIGQSSTKAEFPESEGAHHGYEHRTPLIENPESSTV